MRPFANLVTAISAAPTLEYVRALRQQGNAYRLRAKAAEADLEAAHKLIASLEARIALLEGGGH